VIITRTPLRISLGGGGTDLPSYYREAKGGFLVAAAINKYVYIAVHRNFDEDILLKYSSVERVQRPEDVVHPLLREVLLASDVERGVEISSMADIPAGTGLGSSGSFTVGALRALHAYRRRAVSSLDIAAEACSIEIDRLGEPVGKQDQYIAAVGGVTAFEFHDDETVEACPVPMPSSALDRLEDDLLLFYTGLRRSASTVLAAHQEVTPSQADDLRRNLDAVRDIGRSSFDALAAGDIDTFGALMSEQWRLKFERAPTPVHQDVDRWIQVATDAGAVGGKLVGAGDGGFLLLLASSKADVREAMTGLGLEEVRFGFDHEGTSVIVS
jgi:D-glycero-alpha-D-manno-heptose-7-phosphate kinase